MDGILKVQTFLALQTYEKEAIAEIKPIGFSISLFSQILLDYHIYLPAYIYDYSSSKQYNIIICAVH